MAWLCQMTYFRCPPNFGHRGRRNRNFTKSGTVAFGRNRMYAESATLYTFGAETETEIRSTFSLNNYSPSHLCDKTGSFVVAVGPVTRTAITI